MPKSPTRSSGDAAEAPGFRCRLVQSPPATVALKTQSQFAKAARNMPRLECCLMRRVVSKPLMSASFTSMNTTSGRSALALSSPFWPVAAVKMTVSPRAVRRSSERPQEVVARTSPTGGDSVSGGSHLTFQTHLVRVGQSGSNGRRSRCGGSRAQVPVWTAPVPCYRRCAPGRAGLAARRNGSARHAIPETPGECTCPALPREHVRPS